MSRNNGARPAQPDSRDAGDAAAVRQLAAATAVLRDAAEALQSHIHPPVPAARQWLRAMLAVGVSAVMVAVAATVFLAYVLLAGI